MELFHSPKDVGTEHVSFRVLRQTFHHQFSPVDLVAPGQVPDVIMHQVDAARKKLRLLGSRVLRGSPTCDFVFPSIIRSICLCRGIKKCAVWQTSDKVLETDGLCVCDAAQSFLQLGKCHPDNTFHTNAFTGRFSFLKQHTCRPKKNTTLHFRTLVFARPPVPAPFTCCLIVSKVGLDESLCDVFEVTAPPRCTPCTTLLSHRDAVSQHRPPVRHSTEPDQDPRKLSCLSVSFLAATTSEKILGFDVSHCEL